MAYPQQVSGQDLDKILERADKLFEEAKGGYEEASSKSSVPTFVEAGFKLEEARIKYVVLQEIGSPEKQKLAADRLRAVNQLGKLIHDGKVAVGGTPAEPAPAKPSTPDAAKNPAPAQPAQPAIDVSKRAPIPDAKKQQQADRVIKDLFKEQYAKKSQGDKKALARMLLDQAAKPQDDSSILWVLCHEAQDASIQACDVDSLSAAIDTTARSFDVDAIELRSSGLASAGKNAKTPEEFGAVTSALLSLVDDLIRADQYDPSDKTIGLAAQLVRKSNDSGLSSRVATRQKEVSEAKTLFSAMKGALETQAKHPDDPAANLEIGRFLCFVKGSWDLGLRFIVRGSDPMLKSLAENELAVPVQAADRIALADGWFDLAEKEKSPLRRTQLQAHAKVIYEGALPDAVGVTRARIEKRLEQLKDVGPITATPNAPAKPVLITTAKLTAGAKAIDVAKLLQDLYDRDQFAVIRLDSKLEVGENINGLTKSLLLEGQINGKKFKESYKDGDVVALPRLPTDGVAVPKGSQSFQIISAHYGLGAKFKDVTESIRSKVTDPNARLEGPTLSALCGGDPFPYMTKTLVILYEFRGRRYQWWMAESDSPTVLLKK
jgi:hypothetical protein